MKKADVYIAATAAFLPNAAVANNDMERLLGQIGDKPSRARRLILRSNGICSRYYAIDPQTLQQNFNNAELTAEAVRALSWHDMPMSEIDCLSCGTSIADQLMPNHAVMVQGGLGLPALEAVATTGVCASGMTALKYAYMGVATGQFASAVATGSDLSSVHMRAANFDAEVLGNIEALGRQPEIAFEKDFLRWMLSDGAGAMLLRDKPSSQGLSLRIDWLDIFSFAGEMDTCMYAGAIKNADGSLSGWRSMDASALAADSVMSIKQDVKLLNENVIAYTVEKPLQILQKKRAIDADDVDWFLPHYSSNFFCDKVYAGMLAANFDIPQQRWFSNLVSKGNTGAASMFIMLDELVRSGKLQSGNTVLCYVPESGRFSSAYLHATVV